MKLRIYYLNQILLMIFLILVIFPKEAYAYLDPGSGSYFFQILIATFLGAFLSFKLFWKKLYLYCKKIFSKNEESSTSKK